ncbi:MAG: sodium-dependent transporter [Chlamydiia bacterium]|nr:sodium-dependent transporter [Chlamydiia bacterium]
MKRGSWSSKLGFIFAAAGSAVGLANIWRFPYVVGANGGALFVLVYLFCLFLIGFPIFLAETLIGRTTQKSPSGAFYALSGSNIWGFFGKMTIITGFIVSCFYSAMAAWILGYLIEALQGKLANFSSAGEIAHFHDSLIGSPLWTGGFHLFFQGICFFVLISGVRGGIERCNKIVMPLLYLVLITLVVQGLSLPGSWEGVKFVFEPDFAEVTPLMFLVAMGQAFFTLSLGQGTMVTYGSYLSKKEDLFTSCLPVALMDTLVSLLSAVAVFTIAFSAGIEPDGGESLLFQTLPLVFSKIAGGHLTAVLFFLLVFFAALTSEISAMEPSIAYLVDRFKWRRSVAATLVTAAVFLCGLPFAFSSNILSDAHLWGMNLLELIAFICSSILIPIGGFLAVVLVGWKWGISKAWTQFSEGLSPRLVSSPLVKTYFSICIRWIAPALIGLVFLNALGVV